MSLSSLNDRLNRNRGKQEWEAEVAVPLWSARAAGGARSRGGKRRGGSRRPPRRAAPADRGRGARDLVGGGRSAPCARIGRTAGNHRPRAGNGCAAPLQGGDLARIDANLARGERFLPRRKPSRPKPRCFRPNRLIATSPVQPRLQCCRKSSPSPCVNRLKTIRSSPPPPLPRAPHAPGSRSSRKPAATRRNLAVRMVRDRGEFGEPYANTVGVKLTIPFSSGPRVRAGKRRRPGRVLPGRCRAGAGATQAEARCG
ncbi:MAG: hypothetical protein M5R42_00295 [Rhodocyclaceae bacterium]|nr:hypothetical protein [Rhodocyclaceae bacterium]